MDFHATMPEDGATSSFVLSLEHFLNARQVLEASDDVDRNREEGPDVPRRAEGVHQETHIRANSKPANKPLTRREMLYGLCAFGLPTELLAQTAPGLLSREQFCAMELMGDLAIQTS
ncbi:MAG: hypothetical protein QOJ04_1734 [Caballeronia sp.]|jgi:hypothetical protein|nr:hypothetical protein [Caballeronia sp.]